MRTRVLWLGLALVIGAVIGMALFAPREAAPPSTPAAPVGGGQGSVPLANAMCVRDVLPASKARFDWRTPDYALDGAPAQLSAGELAKAVPLIPVANLAEGTHTLRVAGTEHSFTIDRTAPRLLSMDPPAGTCPGTELRVAITGENACGPVTCRLRVGERIVAEVPARADGQGFTCSVPTPDAEDTGAWQLVLRDGAGNASVHRLDWRTPTLAVTAPAAAAPGETVTARAVGTPGGGVFEARLLSSEALSERVTMEEGPQRSVATLTFAAPADPQVVGIDVGYRLAPECPLVRPTPAEVEVIAKAPAPAAPGRGSFTLLGGGAERLPTCGNGVTDPGEACDGGGPSATCDADCTRPRCGDGLLNPLAGEQCEPGGLTPNCSAQCTLSCGNGQLDQGEACDGGGETARCNLDCTLAACGDGITNFAAGEQCDDGNTANGDGCDARCRVPADFQEEDPSIGARRVL